MEKHEIIEHHKWHFKWHSLQVSARERQSLAVRIGKYSDFDTSSTENESEKSKQGIKVGGLRKIANDL